jgi:homoserine O-acetyltransferase
MRFPRFVLRDMIEAQRRLLTEHLDIDRVHAVVGPSMGGMQALQWAVSHPDLVDRIVAMTPMARTAPWAATVVATARACLMADPAWSGSGFDRRPTRGWRAYAGLMNALLMRTPDALSSIDGREIDALTQACRGFDDAVAAVDGAGFDAHDYLYQSWAYESHDVGTTPGRPAGTAEALATIRARALLLAPPLDLFNPSSSAREAASCISDGRFVEIPSIQGHQAATATSAADVAFLDETIAAFLDVDR